LFKTTLPAAAKEGKFRFPHLTRTTNDSQPHSTQLYIVENMRESTIEIELSGALYVLFPTILHSINSMAFFGISPARASQPGQGRKLALSLFFVLLGFFPCKIAVQKCKLPQNSNSCMMT
jgi:hypothetical protein